MQRVFLLCPVWGATNRYNCLYLWERAQLNNYNPPDDDVALANLNDAHIQPVYPAVPKPPQYAFSPGQPQYAHTVSLQRAPATEVRISSPGRLLLVALAL